MSLKASSSLVVLACFSVVVLTGCGESNQGSTEVPPSLEQMAAKARSKGHDWQAQMLGDGDITLAEYDEGHRRNLACLVAAGLTHTEPVRNPADGFWWGYEVGWEGMADDRGSGLFSECYDDNLGDLELAMRSWGDWRTEPALLAEVEECVRSGGFDIEDGVAKNYREIWLAAAAQGLGKDKVASCINSGMSRLHPGIPYSVGF